MKASVDAKTFYEAMKTVSGAIGRSQVPVLERIRVDFLDGKCRLTVSDLNMWLIKEIPAAGDSFSFLFSDTASVVRACRYYDGVLCVELLGEKDEMKVLLSAGGKSGEFSAEDEIMSPVCPSEKGRFFYTLDAPALLGRITKVRYATAVNKSRPELVGVRFDGRHIWCVDGYRMAVNDDDGLIVERQFILPSYALMQLKVFAAGKAELLIGDKYAVFSAPGVRLVIRQLFRTDGLHVDKVIPNNSTENFSVERKQFLDAVRYLEGCSRGKREHTAVFDESRLFMRNGQHEYSATLKVNGNSSILFAVDIPHLKEALEHLPDENPVRISVTSAHGPVILRSGAADTALIMPVRVRDEWRRDAA